jgi:polysaccharide export outer membrane protein
MVLAGVMLLAVGSYGCSSPPSPPPVQAAAVTQPAAPSAAGQAAEVYRLGPGDKIRVRVFGHEDLSGEFELDGSGNVSLPLIRNVPAQGKTASELEVIISEKLSPEYLRDPKISVEVLNYRPFYVYGEVNKPGSYPYVSGMTVLNAVAIAGGYTYRAKTTSAKLTRGTDPTHTPQTVDRDTPVLPGDVVEIQERYF